MVPQRLVHRAWLLLGLVAALVLGALPLPAAHAAVEWSGPVRPVYAPAGDGTYAYAPSTVSEGGRSYVFSCHSSAAGEIRDSIWLTEVAGDAVQSSRMVLAPSASGWDSRHTCDPSVVAGRFSYAGATYGFAMFYLGTDRDNTNNQIGVAFAASLDGAWVRYPHPLVSVPAGAEATWGVGQPSAVTLDPGSGEVLLFYTDGTGATGGYRSLLVLGDMDEPQVHPARPVTTAGLDGDVLRNFDVAYDRRDDRFYMVREAGPRPAESPTNISVGVEVDSIPGADLRSGAGEWRRENAITPETSGFPRNHNPGLVRTVHGSVPAGGGLDVVFSRSALGPFPETLHSYDLWSLHGTITDETERPARSGPRRSAL